jgi:uncharacterized membrane protein
MTDDSRWRDDRFLVWVIFRIIFSILIAVMVFNLFFNFALGRAMFYNGWFWNIFGLLVLIWFLSWMFRPWHYHGYWDHGHEMRILRRRYARGEISEAQFKKMMKVLRDEDSRHKS